MIRCAVFISPSAKKTLSNHIQKLWQEQEPEKTSNEHVNWLIDQLQDYFLNVLPMNPAGNPRQDLIHKGVRLHLLGFYEIYYFFDGNSVYVAHITRQSGPN